MAYRVCTDCKAIHSGDRNPCRTCRVKRDRARRPSGNPYATPGHRAFRSAVLTRDPICVLCRVARSTVADHYPIERVDLVEQGLDPNDPKRGRGLCKLCHDRSTARRKPAGWNEREP